MVNGKDNGPASAGPFHISAATFDGDNRSLGEATRLARRNLISLCFVLALSVSALGMQEAVADFRAAPVSGYRVINEYPHDHEAYTQGLVIDNGELFEGTGLNGRSSLRRVDLQTGSILQETELSEDYFGEGIAIVRNRIYQLTWQENTCFVYDRESFELIREFAYESEGWGLTHDGKELIMSDGTNRITYRDPETFEETRHIDITDGNQPVINLNELEYINGEIWANVYMTDYVARIDPETGRVVGWIDFSGLLSEHERRQYSVDVLNGIAQDPDSGNIYVTGKLWPTMFEIELVSGK
jgi:glutaminyl-peptide cyclotransferase